MIPLCLSRGAGYLAVKLDLSSAKMDSFRIGNADMLPFPVSEAGRPGEIGETDHDIRLVVFMKTPLSTEELRLPSRNRRPWD